MRRLMLALSIASFIVTPVALAQGRHAAVAKSTAHHSHTRAAGHAIAKSHRNARHERLDDADRSHRLAYVPKSRHHANSNAPRVPDEEEQAIPEQ
ncbi:MAG: hypothetical protein JSR34_02075 [Proteobacteria bacterium]|nr:hypothetical protein [Pseudomonadota bacterium]